MWSSISFTRQNPAVVSRNVMKSKSQISRSRMENFQGRAARVGNKNYQPRKCVFKSESQPNQTSRRQRYFLFSRAIYTALASSQYFLMYGCAHASVLGSLCLPLLCASECETRNLYVTQPVLSLTHTQPAWPENEIRNIFSSSSLVSSTSCSVPLWV